ncbi:hypothetical protein H7X69_02990 [Candidatus Saccharibacteria bacterium]|nr:hypothetical protein [Candidatus Saccharibacteria bacterium]
MTEQPDNTNTYQCAECGLHFHDEAVALQCASWCKEYKSCNLDITKLSVERTTSI